ncbi:CDP-alcohol phosphatidyltransferase family protein [Kangiella shandongensis]|uniref:CDP-alcohol phosphatidyltransferase family protein n=1 Tax=Kangiella shandongensis TaxID=2763258 RepID=UPI001CBD3A36|nr:CDP-alcohol phosphatidyltransferase family protein [Kangiella shandongensis]
MGLNLLPNIITLLRVVLIIPFAYFTWHQDYTAAVIIFLIAGVSDGLDGLLAKRFNWQSRFGSITDPLADKILLFVALLLLVMKGHISWTLFWISTGRDILIVGGATSYHYLVGPYEMRPSIISKWNTALLILLVLLELVHLGWFGLPEMLLSGLEVAVIVTCVVSGVHYLWLGFSHYRNRNAEGSAKGYKTDNQSKKQAIEKS